MNLKPKPIAIKNLKCKSPAPVLGLESIYEASRIADKILQDNPNINIGLLIENLQRSVISTTQCCKLLGISYSAFLRLRKKYNIAPAYSIKNNVKYLHTSFKKFNSVIKTPRAKKNFYTKHQLSMFSKSELELIQLRAARSLKFPNGDKNGWKWSPRGYHSNGKLKARTDNLKKFNIKVTYFDKEDKYMIDYEIYSNTLVSRQEVDKFNIKINKMKVFI